MCQCEPIQSQAEDPRREECADPRLTQWSPSSDKRPDSNYDNMDQERIHQRPFKAIMGMPQPAHVAALVAAVTSALLLMPSDSDQGGGTFLPALLYIFTFAAHVGTQLWMTFVAGILLFFRVERRTFGQVQGILFPAYFLLNGLLGLVTVTSFLRLHPDAQMQALALGGASGCELLARLVVAPPMLRIMNARAALERRWGLNRKVGRLTPEDLSVIPGAQYQDLRKKFVRLHSAAAMANLTALACNAFHLCYLAAKIAQISQLPS